MATIPGALLIALSSPYARRGALWEAYRRHYGQDGDPVLVWQADTASMNPRVDAQVIADAYEQDEAAARAEYGAEFRRDIESFVAREAVDAVVVPGRYELAPLAGVDYVAFVDPSGGSQDSMTLAIAHEEGGRAILDCVREVRPPFSPDAVAAEFAATLERYGVNLVRGDRYGGEWPRERFSVRDVTYQVAERSKSDIYLEFLPLLNSGRVELLDHTRTIAQLCALERRTARGGRDSVDHPPGGHDDLINAVAGALVTALRPPAWRLLDIDDGDAEEADSRHPYDVQIARVLPAVRRRPEEPTCGDCISRRLKNGQPWCGLRLFWIDDRDVACEAFDLREPGVIA
jgi:hypothetical protein